MVRIDNVLNELFERLQKNSYSTDTYDLYSLKTFSIKSYSAFIRLIKRFLICYEILFPYSFRYIFKIKKSYIAKGDAVFGLSCLKLFKLTGNSYYYDCAKDVEGRLLNDAIFFQDKLAWGYPFDWHTYIEIPARTPNAVSTVYCLQFFLEMHAYTPENTQQRYTNIISEITNFFKSDLLRVSKKSSWFAYTKHDEFQVHNANLLVCDSLVKAAILLKNQELLKLCLGPIKFSLEPIVRDGFLPYWGDNSRKKYGIKLYNDHYHIGFELRALKGLLDSLNSEQLALAYAKYSNWYLNNMFFECLPMHEKGDKSIFPIDAHTISESIIVLSDLNFERSTEIVNFFLDNFLYLDSRVGHKLYRILGFKYLKKINHRRWAEAWALLALTSYMECKVEKNINVS